MLLSRGSQARAAAIQESRWIELQAKENLHAVWKFYLHRTGPCPGARGARGSRGLFPAESAWSHLGRRLPRHGACFTLGRHGFRWVGPLWAVGAVIHDSYWINWYFKRLNRLINDLLHQLMPALKTRRKHRSIFLLINTFFFNLFTFKFIKTSANWACLSFLGAWEGCLPGSTHGETELVPWLRVFIEERAKIMKMCDSKHTLCGDVDPDWSSLTFCTPQ